jgi:hypothetical protein
MDRCVVCASRGASGFLSLFNRVLDFKLFGSHLSFSLYRFPTSVFRNILFLAKNGRQAS